MVEEAREEREREGNLERNFEGMEMEAVAQHNIYSGLF